MTNADKKVYWSHFQVNDWRFYLAKTDAGVCYIGSPNRPFTEVETWLNKKLPKHTLLESDNDLQKEIDQLTDYINGKRQNFTINMNPVGTEFQRIVWQALQTIPFGETRTYSEIAADINHPEAVRAVGTAIGANPLLIVIPCHRIIAKNGKLSGFRAGVDVKQTLLQLEKNNQA